MTTRSYPFIGELSGSKGGRLLVEFSSFETGIVISDTRNTHPDNLYSKGEVSCDWNFSCFEPVEASKPTF